VYELTRRAAHLVEQDAEVEVAGLAGALEGVNFCYVPQLYGWNNQSRSDPGLWNHKCFHA
jgi:hypothetical protein